MLWTFLPCNGWFMCKLSARLFVYAKRYKIHKMIYDTTMNVHDI